MPSILHMGRVGNALLPWRTEDQEELARYPEKTVLKIKATRPRSNKAHRFYFKVIAVACHHWPENADPCPGKNDADMLRYWLQCKAGYHDRIDFPEGTTDALGMLIKKIRGEGKYCFIQPRMIGGEAKICVFTPQSIAYEEMDETEFRPVRDAVFEIIEEIVGLAPDQLVLESEMSA